MKKKNWSFIDKINLKELTQKRGNHCPRNFLLLKKLPVMWTSEADLERVAKFYRRAFLLLFEFVWKVLLSDRIFSILLDTHASIIEK